MFVLVYIIAWGTIISPALYAWLSVWMIIKDYFSKWDGFRGEYILPEKYRKILAPAFAITTALLIIGISIWCWYIADDVLNFFRGLKGE